MASLLAILGRGIQHSSANTDAWALTPDLEVCDEKGAHLLVRVPENDDDTHSIIGGGELNILAGAILTEQSDPALLLCAYGARSKYLNQIGAPSESNVMSDKLITLLKTRNSKVPTVEVYDEIKYGADESGTNREIYNVLMRAAELNIGTVNIVTVAVHLPRATLMAEQHIAQKPDFKNIMLQCYASELVLIKSSATEYATRVHRVLGSKSYMRNLDRELQGMNDLLAGKYKSVASVTK